MRFGEDQQGEVEYSGIYINRSCSGASLYQTIGPKIIRLVEPLDTRLHCSDYDINCTGCPGIRDNVDVELDIDEWLICDTVMSVIGCVGGV